MLVTLERKYKKSGYTIGHLFIDGVYVCDTLEDRDRGLRSDMFLADIKAVKVYGETAIPAGSYRLVLAGSPTFGNRSWAKRHDGRLPLLVGVPGFEGVRIHPGNWPEDTLGCILPGFNKIRGGVLNSVSAYNTIMARFLSAEARGEEIKIKIK